MGQDTRFKAIEILSKVLLMTEDEDWFKNELCQGRLITSQYNPSSDLCHWFLWKLGCRDSRILCRDVPEFSINYTNEPIQKLCNGARRLSAWRTFHLENHPCPGDILHTGSNIRGELEHICIFLRKNQQIWFTADVVRSKTNGKWAVIEMSKKQVGSNLIDQNEVSKQVNGWTDICSLKYDV